MNQLPVKLTAWLADKQIIIECVLAVLVAFSGVFKFLSQPGADEALMISMLTLSSFYFLIAFTYSGESQIIQIPAKIFSIASSVCVIGLLFVFLRLPGAREQLIIGLLSLGISGAVIIFLMITSRIQKFIPVLIRLVVLGGLSLNTFMTLNANAVQ